MNRWKTLSSMFVLSLAVAGCSTTPEKYEMTQLGTEGLHDLVIGNTTTYPTEYGRWADYHATEETSYARAWGDWGQQDAGSTHVTSPDGRMCHQYTGPHKWAGPEHEYCGVLYEDNDGNYYYKTLKNTSSPEKVGEIVEIEIKPGDPYGLAE